MSDPDGFTLEFTPLSTDDFTGVGGRRCTLKWYATRRWNASRVVYEHHYDLRQIGGPLIMDDDLNLGSGGSDVSI